MQNRCLAVKLAAEVSDLSEEMRTILLDGTAQVTACLAKAVEAGNADGSLRMSDDPSPLATQQYQLWLGAILMAKVTKGDTALQTAIEGSKRQLL
ncbi:MULTISPECIES: TetR family transcriptional regulator C-terminal domain-containing protein [unclassified Sulfitobacter]|uniref:TetR family transcriptional regulator C-terminal domain-containing protein n=1 Tax=unclassified Sulfitobacter TaxID=196795 RepID=UPI003744D5D8